MRRESSKQKEFEASNTVGLYNDEIVQSLAMQIALLDKVVQRRPQWFGRVERAPVD